MGKIYVFSKKWSIPPIYSVYTLCSGAFDPPTHWATTGVASTTPFKHT